MEHTKATKNTNADTHQFPPVVAVLGHVDHGKTSLLDAIRKSSVVEREKGGITQKIGASSVEIIHEGKKRWITFIDTPGHEAFTKMRSRGAQAADIGILVISSSDGVKPQTRESIEALKASKIPFIVALTKSDLPNKNVEKTKQELLKEHIQLEDFGGDVPAIEVSAKANYNIKELLDLVLLLFDMHKKPDYEKVVSASAPLEAIVIESKLDTKAGAKATVVVKNGRIAVRDVLQSDGLPCKVRTLINDHGKQVASASVGEAVEILGFAVVPTVGSMVVQKSELPVVREEPVLEKPMQRELVYRRAEKVTGLSVILVTDTQGSLEAVVNALPKEVTIVSKKTGEVTEADILLAKSTGSIVLSFNTKVKPDVTRFAFSEKVLLRSYEIIYELLDELEDALQGHLLSQMEQVYGKAKILAKFPFEKTFAFGVNVTEGRVARGDRVRIMRGEEPLGEASLTSLRIGKNSVSKVEKGHEAGILLASPLDIRVGDVIVSHS